MSALSTNRVLVLFRNVCSAPAMCRYPNMPSTKNWRSGGADYRTTDANQAWDFCGCGSLRTASKSSVKSASRSSMKTAPRSSVKSASKSSVKTAAKEQ